MNLAHQLLITAAAEVDIAEAQQWYQEQAGLGAAFVSRVGDQLEFIASQPLATPVVAQNIRRAVVAHFPYNIYYAINGRFIHILAVWHGSRDQTQLLSERTRMGGT